MIWGCQYFSDFIESFFTHRNSHFVSLDLIGHILRFDWASIQVLLSFHVLNLGNKMNHLGIMICVYVPTVQKYKKAVPQHCLNQSRSQKYRFFKLHHKISCEVQNKKGSEDYILLGYGHVIPFWGTPKKKDRIQSFTTRFQDRILLASIFWVANRLCPKIGYPENPPVLSPLSYQKMLVLI